jgi:hypothetical protein
MIQERLASFSNEMVVFFVMAIMIVVGFGLFYTDYTVYFDPIPKRIWTYYEAPLNETEEDRRIQAEIHGWSVLHPGWEITVLTQKNARGYLEIPSAVFQHPLVQPHTFKDEFKTLLRFYALTQHGGVWLEQGVELKTPLPQWLFTKYADLALISNTMRIADIDTRLMAAKKNNPFLIAWRDEWIQLTDFQSHEEYLHSRVRLGPVDVSMIEDPMSHLEKVALQTILQFGKLPQEDPTILIQPRIQ